MDCIADYSDEIHTKGIQLFDALYVRLQFLITDMVVDELRRRNAVDNNLRIIPISMDSAALLQPVEEVCIELPGCLRADSSKYPNSNATDTGLLCFPLNKIFLFARCS